MSKNLNTVSLVGRVGGDPEVRIFESGSILAKVSLAVKRRGKDLPPDWFAIEFWGNPAKVIADYVNKGSLIGVTGSLKIDRWTDKDGNQRQRPYIHAHNLELLGSKRESNDDRATVRHNNNSTNFVSGFKIPSNF